MSSIADSTTTARDVLDGVARADALLLDQPHILVCHDRGTGVTTYTGPFPTGYDALAVIDEHESGQQPAAGARSVVCELAPLLAPEDDQPPF